MGDLTGPTARNRVAMWMEINRAFSPFNIDKTKNAYKSYKKKAGEKAHFIDFAVVQGWVPKDMVKLWKSGANRFAPGTFDIVSEVVFRNLEGRYSTFQSGPKVPQGKRPLPMLFERTFGEEEFLTVRPTRHGLKVTMCSTEKGYAKSEAFKMAERWGQDK